MMNGFNQYICDYCNNPCRKLAFDIAHMQCCTYCDIDIRYNVTKKGIVNYIEYYYNDYCIIVNFKHKFSEIMYFYKPRLISKQLKSTIIKSFNYCLDINPKNIHDKLKTYLLFL